MKVEELIERYKAGERDFRGAELPWAYLREADLRGADLSRAKLREVDLRGANLHGAKLRGADLRWAELPEVDLSGAYLCAADLRCADLRCANLRRADLSKADLTRACLQAANLRGAKLRGVYLGGANLSQALLPDLAIPRIEEIDRVILNALQKDLDLQNHIIKLAGKASDFLADKLGTHTAASLIYAKSSPHSVPDWNKSKPELLKDMQLRVNELTQDKNEMELA